MKTKGCPKCKQEKSVEAFSANTANRNGLQSYCKPCMVDHNKGYNVGWLKKRKAKLDSLKQAPCMDCGVEFPPECMDFDHIKGEKLFNIANARYLAWGSVLAEIAKCELVCSKCHRLRTVERNGS